MNIELENLFSKACNEGINVFTGAGFSINSYDKENQPLPLGAKLAEELSTLFAVSKNLPLPNMASIIESRNKVDFYDYLKSRMHVKKFDDEYKNIECINIKGWFTTNIDNLTEMIFEDSNKYYLNNNLIHGPSFADKSAIEFYALHGSILYDARPLVFTSLSIASTFSANPKLWNDLIRAIEKFPVLFWGYSMSDSGILQALNSLKVQGLEKTEKWIVLYKGMPEEEEYFRSLGFNIIIASNKELLKYLKTKINLIPEIDKTTVTTKELFGQQFIPNSTSDLPLREINHFYLGAAPTWSDIFSNNLIRTSHFRLIQNLIFAGKNTIVVGTPASGKTTLLMQLAAFTEFKGHKIILEHPTVEKAKLIAKKLDGLNALIFIDNFTDEIQSFVYLNKFPNIKLIGFDREHNFEIVSNFVDRTKFNIYQATTLTDADIQEIFSKIPDSIKNKILKRKRIEGDEQSSLFEFISLNLRFPEIRIRYRNIIDELESKDELLTDFLLLASYVHQCRTPLSFDMTYSYFQDYISGYKEVYELRQQLGALLTDFPGELVDDDTQDYFTPRSTIVSETIMEQVPSKFLRRMLHRFVDNLPPYKVVDYKIFRIRGNDKKIMIAAFPDWEEGKYYYERLMQDNPNNPYILQQGALYLSYKGKYAEAFFWIDKSRNLTNDRVFSIRNSHAIILFEANIHKDNTTVRPSLDSSMDILKRCYLEDKRKLYHAMKFSEQAIEYYEKYKDSKANEYLAQASVWLDEEIKINDWHTRLKFLKREIDSIYKPN